MSPVTASAKTTVIFKGSFLNFRDRMGSHHVRRPVPKVKVLAAFLISIILSETIACHPSSAPSAAKAQILTVLADPAPITLNPRMAVDASGQRLGALLFRGLTRIDADLRTKPDLASHWRIEDGGKIWVFSIAAGQQDHAGALISAEKITACLENYRKGVPSSPLRAAFPFWKETFHSATEVFIKLEKADPYFGRNISLLRYFRTNEDPSSLPCQEPISNQAIIGNGAYRLSRWELTPEEEATLVPIRPGPPSLRFLFTQDDNTKALQLLRGEVDMVQNSLSLAKTRWIQNSFRDRFRILERDGVRVSYLAFNLKNPLLSRKEIRRAISEAIDRDEIIHSKLLGFAAKAGSFLSPLLPESHSVEIPYDPPHSEELLEKAGFPKLTGGFRFVLQYKTTPVREGIETALIIQEKLRKVGIKIIIDVVEPAVFLSTVRKGNFQLYSSRWLGISDGSILYRTLHSTQPDNRVSYRNPKVDKLLEQAMAEPDLSRRIRFLREVQDQMMEDLPYFPLWYWNNGLIMRKDLAGIEASDLSLSGALEPLARIRYESSL